MMATVGRAVGDTPRDTRAFEGGVVVAALAGMLVLGGVLALQAAPRFVALFAVGGLLGVALYHAAFGFTGGWRRYVVDRRADGMRAQLALLALASLLIVPVLALADSAGLRGAIAPVGVPLLVGAFLFGAGMQLGGGCGSGTLFTAGSGHLRMVVTLVFFIVGSVVGTFHLPWWLGAPGLGAVDLTDGLGVGGALALQLAACGGLALWLTRRERQRHGASSRRLLAAPEGPCWRHLVQGPWPLIWGVVALAVGNLAVLLIAGHPWGITFAFALWGAKLLQAVGVDMSQFEYWTWAYPAAALRDSVLTNTYSVSNFGLLLGSLLAAGCAGRFRRASRQRIPPRALLAAVLGGLMMGYGARLAFGCNIGAMFSGIASASLHGWIWFAAAWVGSLVAIRARPWFGLGNG